MPKIRVTNGMLQFAIPAMFDAGVTAITKAERDPSAPYSMMGDSDLSAVVVLTVEGATLPESEYITLQVKAHYENYKPTIDCRFEPST